MIYTLFMGSFMLCLITIHRMQSEDHERGLFCSRSKYWQSLYRKGLWSFGVGCYPHRDQPRKKNLSGYSNEDQGLHCPAHHYGWVRTNSYGYALCKIIVRVMDFSFSFLSFRYRHSYSLGKSSHTHTFIFSWEWVWFHLWHQPKNQVKIIIFNQSRAIDLQNHPINQHFLNLLVLNLLLSVLCSSKSE